jgi:hypothetical protein
MAYYCSKVLQDTHGPALKKFLSGKSCMKFKHSADVPEDALRGIVGSTPNFLPVARETFAKRKKR